MQELRLVKPTAAMEAAYHEMRADYVAAGEGRSAGPDKDYPGWVERLEGFERGTGLPGGWVPGTSWFLRRSDGKLLGHVRLRHRLTPALWQDGGHIGYDIRPSERNRGYGTRILALALEKARARGLSWVLLTVAPSNTPSIRVIERNGGSRIGVADRSGNLQYRIDLDPQGCRP